VRGTGMAYAKDSLVFGHTLWDFDGQEIFRRAVAGMSRASAEVLAKCGRAIEDIDLVVPHQANRRIIDFVAKRLEVPAERVFVTVGRYGNMSAATVPVALVDALEAGRVAPGALLLTPAFGGGLTWCAHLIRWGERVTPRDATDVTLPPCDRTALEIVRETMARHAGADAHAGALHAPMFADSAEVTS